MRTKNILMMVNLVPAIINLGLYAYTGNGVSLLFGLISLSAFVAVYFCYPEET